MPTATAPSENPLRLEVCPDCGYSLEGLPDDSACPECGRACDSSMIVLYGWGRGDHANLGTCSPETLVGYAVMGGLFLVCLCIFLFDAPVLVVMVLGLWGVMSLRVVRRFGVGFPGLVQVRLRDIGCEQRNDLRGPSMWTDLRPVMEGIFWVGCGLYILSAARANPAWWVPVCAFAFTSVWQIGKSWRRRQSARLARDPAAEGFVPWSKIDRVLIEPAGAGRHLICLRCPAGWLSTSIPVDAEVHCTKRQAEELRRRIEEWRERCGKPCQHPQPHEQFAGDRPCPPP